MTYREIYRNRAQCLLCGDILESMEKEHREVCSCENLLIEGGTDYTQRFFSHGRDSWIELTEYVDPEEDAADLAAYEEAMKEYLANPVTYTMEEVLEMLELD